MSEGLPEEVASTSCLQAYGTRDMSRNLVTCMHMATEPCSAHANTHEVWVLYDLSRRFAVQSSV